MVDQIRLISHQTLKQSKEMLWKKWNLILLMLCGVCGSSYNCGIIVEYKHVYEQMILMSSNLCYIVLLYDVL